MRLARNLILIGLACSLSSCFISNYMRTIQVETMKPAVFNIPENVHSVAIFNLTPIGRNNLSFEYMEGNSVKKDSTVNYTSYSNKCTKALADFLAEENYFDKVRNLGDTLEYLKPDNSGNTDLFQKTGADACIFLNGIDFKIIAIRNLDAMLVNNATLTWSVSYKNDSLSYWYNQSDTLIFEGEEFTNSQNLIKRLYSALESSSVYLGKAFGSKIIPTWIRVERMYYQSNNAEMLIAEKYAKDNQWMKAAEIWNKLTKNKNTVMAAKASYNMALACEMEGNLDAAIDWLVKSYSVLKENNKEHQDNCQRYISLLAMRKKEIEKLAKQVRN